MVPVAVSIQWIENSESYDCQILGCRHVVEQNGFVAQERREKPDHRSIPSPDQKRVIPHIDEVLLGDRLHFGEVHDHPIDRGAGDLDNFPCQRDLQRVPVSMQVSARALVIRDAVTGIEFEPSSDAHATQGGLDQGQIIASHEIPLFLAGLPLNYGTRFRIGSSTRCRLYDLRLCCCVAAGWRDIDRSQSQSEQCLQLALHLLSGTGAYAGAPPAVDLPRLGRELRSMLELIAARPAASQSSQVEDIAFSGNGEPTLSPMFAPAVEVVSNVWRDMQRSGRIKIRLITNGSRVLHPDVQEGLRCIAAAQGEAWFKVDGGSRESILRTNDVELSPHGVSRRLAICAELVSTWVQTCVFSIDGVIPDEVWLRDYLAILDAAGPARLKGVLLYGLARQSMQLEANRLSRLSLSQIEEIASAIRKAG